MNSAHQTSSSSVAVRISSLPSVSTPSKSASSVPSPHLACAVDSDCTSINTSCDFCSCGDPINKEYVDQYNAERLQRCKNYAGAVCDMDCPRTVPTCVDQECVLKEV